MSKHTKGPWVVRREGRSTVYGAVEASLRPYTWQEVAACGPTEAGSEQQEANARLIAAAPELLEACQLLVSWLDLPQDAPMTDMVVGCGEAERKARAAILKATGEQP